MPVRIAVVVPGILGSALHYPNGQGGKTEIWGADFGANYARLLANPALLNWSGNVAGADLLTAVHVKPWIPWAKALLWKRVLDVLTRPQWFGPPDLLLKFGYDWRRSLRDTVPDLIHQLDVAAALAARNRNVDMHDVHFTFVTHSMGGLLVRCAVGIGALPTNRIDRIVHIGTPLLGSASAFRSTYQTGGLPFLRELSHFIHGKNTAAFYTILLNAVQTFPSIYQLMPPSHIDFLFYSPTVLENPLSAVHQGPINSLHKQEALIVHDHLRLAELQLSQSHTRVYSIYRAYMSDRLTDFAYHMEAPAQGPYHILDQLGVAGGDGTVLAHSANSLPSCHLLPLGSGMPHAFMCNDQHVAQLLATVL